jgi:hypothetical protein
MGASRSIKDMLTIGASLGFLAYFSLIVYLFFIVPWWHPVLLFAVSAILSGFIDVFLNRLRKIDFILLILIDILSFVGIISLGTISWLLVLS